MVTDVVVHNGQGPFGPVRTFVTVRDGRKVVPLALLRYLCTAPRDIEGQYGDEAPRSVREASEQRVQRRVTAFRARFPDIVVE